MVKDIYKVEEVTKAIKDLEYKQNTSSFKNASEENALISKIKQLKASIPKAERLSEILPHSQELRDKKKALHGELNTVKSEAKKREEEIE